MGRHQKGASAGDRPPTLRIPTAVPDASGCSGIQVGPRRGQHRQPQTLVRKRVSISRNQAPFLKPTECSQARFKLGWRKPAVTKEKPEEVLRRHALFSGVAVVA